MYMCCNVHLPHAIFPTILQQLPTSRVHRASVENLQDVFNKVSSSRVELVNAGNFSLIKISDKCEIFISYI